ncbi:MAG: hypothetical protein GYB16_15595 [Gammaproteobacteria bacterium]|nr:hypothetical protein [Gammaproteobacteria bacterium]
MLKVLVSGALYNIVNIVAQILLGLVVFREMLLHFGEADFGTWTLLFAILAHVKLFEFGLGSIISKLVPILKNGDSKNVSYFSTAIVAMVLIFAAFLAVLVAVALIGGQVILQFQGTEAFTLVLFLMGCNFLFLYLTGAFHAYLTGSFKVGRLNSVRLFINILRSVLIIGFLQFNSSVVIVAYIFALTSFLELLLLFWISVKSGFFDDLDLSTCSISSFSYVAERGYKLFFLSVNDYVRQNALVIVCGFILGVIAIVPLRIAGRLMEIYVQISVSLNYILTPYFSAMAIGDNNSVNRKFLISINCATTLSALVFLNIVFVGDWFLALWLGDVPQYTSEVMKIIAIGFFIETMQGPCTSLLISKDKNKIIMVLCILEASILIAIIYPFVKIFGIIGAAYAVVVSLGLTRGVFQPIIIKRFLKVRLFSYYANLMVPTVFIALNISLLKLVAMSFDFTNEDFTLISFIALQAVVAIAAAFYLRSKIGEKN